MKTLNMLLACFTFALVSVGNSIAQEWRGIIPLKSSRADVERLFGHVEGGYGVTYALTDGNLFVEYSSGPCKDGRKEGWNVPEDTVISFSFSPTIKQRVEDLKVEQRRFKKVKDGHIDWGYYLVNENDGIMYDVQDGMVENVEYYPPPKYNNLRCTNIVGN